MHTDEDSVGTSTPSEQSQEEFAVILMDFFQQRTDNTVLASTLAVQFLLQRGLSEARATLKQVVTYALELRDDVLGASAIELWLVLSGEDDPNVEVIPYLRELFDAVWAINDVPMPQTKSLVFATITQNRKNMRAEFLNRVMKTVKKGMRSSTDLLIHDTD